MHACKTIFSRLSLKVVRVYIGSSHENSWKLKFSEFEILILDFSQKTVNFHGKFYLKSYLYIYIMINK